MAVKALVSEKRASLRHHPTLEELEAYHQGKLSIDRHEATADHLTTCENCTILLLFAVTGPEGGSRSGEALGVEAAWNRLRPHITWGLPAGRRLAEVREQGRLSVESAQKIALQVICALSELHSNGRLLHTLRAEDVLVSPCGEVHLLDLGTGLTPEIGYERSAGDAVVELYRSLSPEQVVGEGLDQRSNLFSFGVLLYEMTTGVSPFRDSTPIGTASRILSLEPPPARDLNPAIPPALSRLIDRLIAKEPENRPTTAAAVARELRSIVGGQSEDAGPETANELDVGEQIEQLYDEIIALAAEQPTAAHGSLESAYAKLLELQQDEAERFRRRFEASLSMPIDAGHKLLGRLSVLREELEDLASSNPAAEDADDSTPSAG